MATYSLTLPEGVTAKAGGESITGESLKAIVKGTKVDLAIAQDNKALKTLKVGETTYKAATGEAAGNNEYLEGENYTYTASVTMDSNKVVTVEWYDIVNYIGTYKEAETFDSYSGAGWTMNAGTFGNLASGVGMRLTDVTNVGPLPAVGSEYTTATIPTYVDGKVLSLEGRGGSSPGAASYGVKHVISGQIHLKSDVYVETDPADKAYDTGYIALRDSLGAEIAKIEIVGDSATKLGLKGHTTTSVDHKSNARESNKLGFNIDLVLDLDTKKASCTFDYIANGDDDTKKTRYEQTVNVAQLNGNNVFADLYLHQNSRNSTSTRLTLDNTQFYAVTTPAEDATYTIKYMKEGTQIRTETLHSVVGAPAVVPASYKEPFKSSAEGAEHKYKCGDTFTNENAKIAAATGTEVTVEVTQMGEYQVAVKASTGQTIKEATTVYEGETLNYTYPKYIVDAQHKVLAQATPETFTGSKTVTSEDHNDIEVEYTQYNDGTAYCWEVDTGAAAIDNASLSDGKATRNFSSSDYHVDFDVPEDGSYKITIAGMSTKDGKNISVKQDQTSGTELVKVSLTTANTAYSASTQDYKELTTSNKLVLSPDANEAGIDYLLIEKQSE